MPSGLSCKLPVSNKKRSMKHWPSSQGFFFVTAPSSPGTEKPRQAHCMYGAIARVLCGIAFADLKSDSQ